MTPSTKRETIGAYSVANFGSQNIIKLRNNDNGTVNYGFTCDGYIGKNNLSFYVSVKPTYNNFTIDSLGSGGSLSCTVSAIAVGVNGSIYAGGNFTSMGGAPNTRGIAKWDGSSWSALGTGAQDGSVLAIAVSLDGSIYAGGTFTSIGGVAANYIAKWNGSIWSVLGTGANNCVRALAVGIDGSIYAGGDFTSIGGVAANRIAKWYGSSWSALGNGGDSAVHALAVGLDGCVYAGGDFTLMNGVANTRCVAKINNTFTWSLL
jgi:hypothetical protein